MTQKESLDFSILESAQNFVDDWFRSANRAPFDKALLQAANLCWTGPLIPPVERMAFAMIADAIRTGRGHAVTNREPLLAMLERVLAQAVRENELTPERHYFILPPKSRY